MLWGQLLCESIAFLIQVDKLEKSSQRVCTIKDRVRETVKRGVSVTSIPIVLFALAFLSVGYASAEVPTDLVYWRDFLVQKLVARGIDEVEAVALFNDTRLMLYPEILQKKGKGIDYFHRRFGLLTRASIERGRQIVRDNQRELKKIETLFGVEKEAIVAIYRVETNFGRYTGNYPVFNSLLTLTVMENRRSAWAENEWITLVLLGRERGFDPLAVKGSWAGAFGLCQFVPTSYLQFGVDGNGDGRVDLFNLLDALASIANYLKGYGWENGDTAKKEKAVYAYNHCDNYVKAVLAYAQALRKNGQPKSVRRPHIRSNQKPA